MSEPTTMDMSTGAVAARIRQTLENNDDWFESLYIDRGDVIAAMVDGITAAVTGEQRDQAETEPLPDPVLLRTFPVDTIPGGRITQYRAQFEVQFQWIEIVANVVAVRARPAEVRCYRTGDWLMCRIVADDGSVYAQVARLLDGGW